jgi:hypothetical protein
MVLPVVKPLQKSVMIDWLDARGCQIVKETDEAMYVKIDSPCQHLLKSDGKFLCEIYRDRPEGCETFDGRRFDFIDCAWKKGDVMEALIKSIDEEYEDLRKNIPGWIGARKGETKGERRRMSKRASRERKQEKKENIALYGSDLESE